MPAYQPLSQHVATGSRYRGRFAPSPTGPLHFGSLVTAVASWLDARAAGGEWLLRIEDIDPPREVRGATQMILRTLEAHGFQWPSPVRYQSQRLAHFETAVEQMLVQDFAYACRCSRQAIRNVALPGPAGLVYPGTCRALKLPVRRGETSVRLRTQDDEVSFEDRLQGTTTSLISQDIGDFIIRRKDGLISYVLAVVIDDNDQGITDVVRGYDLLGFTPAQIFLRQQLGLGGLNYMHLPVAVDARGDKLSKQAGAKPVDDDTPAENLYRCLTFLAQAPPRNLLKADLDTIWEWAAENWDPTPLTGLRKKVADYSNFS
jgi:glutamyl-Q tRNA(Asp) synthetase